MQTWVANIKSKFEGDPTINEFKIVILPKWVLGQSQNYTVPMQMNQTTHNLTSTSRNRIKIIHPTLQLTQINQITQDLKSVNTWRQGGSSGWYNDRIF